MVRLSVCALIRKDDKILAVARRGTTDQWGLPGGKPEEGETLQEALVREVFEETGIRLDPMTFRKVFETVDDNNYHVITFSTYTCQAPQQGDAGPVQYVTPEELLAGPFPVYNRGLLQAVGVLES